MKPYRKNVGIVVFNSKSEVLVGKRVGPNRDNWQYPQGGIDGEEEPREAAVRELYEEVGIRDALYISEASNWISYDFPKDLDIKLSKKYKGQIQKWFLFFWDKSTNDCDLHVHDPEFEVVKFVPIDTTISSVVGFKKNVYEEVYKIFDPQIKKYLESIK